MAQAPGIRSIPFAAMGGVYEQDDREAVLRVLDAACQSDQGFFPLPEEDAFQQAMARHEGAARAIAVNSCGTALDCCMMALGVGPGDEVITTPLTFVCTAGTAVARGAKAVFADIDPATLNLDPAEAGKRITPRTKAIIPVHFAGLACDVEAFDRLSAETGVPVIYDAAHAVGAKYRGLPIGNRGRAACYSFQSNKNMTCLGEGGAVTTDDEELAEKIRRLKTFGYVYGGPALGVASIGFNYRMTKVQYAVGITQLAKVDRVIRVRQERMALLNTLLGDVDELILPAGIGPQHACHIYVVRLDTDKAGFGTPAFVKHLKDRYKVGTARHYPAVWTWQAFADLGYDGAGCPVAARACEQVVSLPVFPRTTQDDCRYIAWAVRETIADLRRA